MKLITTALLFVTLMPLVSAQEATDVGAAVESFERAFKSGDEQERIGEVENLAFIDAPETAAALIQTALLDKSVRVRLRAAWSLSRKTDPKAVALIIAGLKHKKITARIGCARALAKLKDPSHVPALADALAGEKKEMAQLAILEALTLFARDADVAVPRALDLTGHRTDAVAIAAIRMVGHTENPAHAPSLHGLLKKRDWRRQSATLSALGRLRSKESIPLVIDFMDGLRGRLLGEARECLMSISGRQFGYKVEQWRKWWESAKGRFEVPEKKVEKDQDLEDKYAREDRRPDYHRIKTLSKKILFVIDVSSSMRTKIRYKPMHRKGGYQTKIKMDLAKEELKRVIETLDKNTSFNIYTFEAVMNSWKPTLVRATPGSIGDAKRWIDDLQPFTEGGQTKQGWMRGETNTFGVLKWIYGLKGPGLNFSGKLKVPADTVFLLSDGEATCGELIVNDEIIEQIEDYHAAGNVTIHTIAYELTGVGRQLLSDIARVSGGRFVEIGAKR